MENFPMGLNGHDTVQTTAPSSVIIFPNEKKITVQYFLDFYLYSIFFW